MKKFLSLLLALTLVLSLVVVPARAADGITGTLTVKKGKETTLTAPTAPEKVTVEEGATSTEYPVISNSTTYSWTSGTTANATIKDNDNDDSTVVITGVKKGDSEITLTMTVTYKKSETPSDTGTKDFSYKTTVHVTDPEGDAANAAFASNIVIKCNNREYAPNANGKIIAYKYDNEDAATWTASLKDGASEKGYALASSPVSLSSGVLTVKGTYTKDETVTNVEANFTVEVKDVSVSITSSITGKAAGSEEVLKGGVLTLTPSYVGGSSSVNYKWFDKDNNELKANSQGVYTVPTTTAGNLGKFTCKVYENGQENPAATAECTVNVVEGDYRVVVNPDRITLSEINATRQIEATFQYKDGTYKASAEKVTYNFRSSSSGVQVSPSTNSTNGKATVKLVSSTPSATITVTVTYKGKPFTATVAVTGTVLEAQLSSVQSGSTETYYTNDFINAAQTVLNARGSSYSSEIVQSVTRPTLTNGSTYGTVTHNTVGSTNGYMTFSANNTIGTAQFSATVTTYRGNIYGFTFNLPVKPATTTYEDQYPEPVASGNTYRYYVQVPSGAKYYYVAGVNSEPSNWNNGSSNKYYTTTSSTSLYYLTDSNFTSGKCTLYVVTQGTDNKLYCGTITVYQKNYNINYNGVAGETVQFAQSDFTDFMTEVAEARGDASKTKSYPYVTFDYVTFSLPTTAQGTLYYGGTAMSTSNSSGAFNTRTKVTNLDSVTFVPNAKSTAKTITLNFTLYATRYSSSSTSRGTTVSYSGSVVVNLVREDIKYTVSQGDSVRFDESDFLNYLRSTKGYSSNYTIDYVTFDQSAVSAVNEGSLYTYYNGYNYGGSVKTTDKFYYSATASQNALSDVAFLASRYAKTGETVYIPFTIYARYGSTGTGTRQLTGTVAIKIGQTMNFIDVKTTDYFYNSVKWAVGKNITNGTSSTTFSPYKSCTRAEIVTFLWRAAGSPEPTITRNPFRDVNAVTHSSYYKAILWASQKGITSGTSATAFSPDQVCTRAQIVTFLYRYAGQPSGYYSNPFKDVGATSEASYYNAILWAVGKGITTGTSATTFSPYASCNRAEAVTFLYRYTNGL